MGDLWADSEAFGALKLTDSARGVLKGETAVLLREEAETPRTPAAEDQDAARPSLALPARTLSARAASPVQTGQFRLGRRRWQVLRKARGEQGTPTRRRSLLAHTAGASDVSEQAAVA
jgi:hypothetical protein